METTTAKEPDLSIAYLPDKKVKVEVIKRDSEWLPKGHDAEGMFSGARFGVDLPRDLNKGGQLVNPFANEDERKFFEKELSMPEGTLSIHKPEGQNFWKGPKAFKVYVDKTGLTLNLSEPMDMLRYKVLKANRQTVAASWAQRFGSPGFKYVLIEEGEQISERLNESQLRRKADRFLGNISTSKRKMKDLLRVYYAKFGMIKKVPDNASSEFYESEIDKLITDGKTLPNLVSVFEDPFYEMKLFIEDAITAGAINKPSKNTYVITGTDEEYTQVELIEFLNPKGKNQDLYLKIKDQIKISE